MNVIKRIKKFAQTIFVGGLSAILPLALLILIFRWIINLIEKYLEPFVNLFEPKNQFITVLIYIIIVSAIAIAFFLIGLFVRTKLGNIIIKSVENKYLRRIPGYKTISDIVNQVFGGNRSFFSEVVLVDIFNTGVLMTGFITDTQEKEKIITVFVPTGPNPTSGNIYHLPKAKVFRSKSTVDIALKTIVSCGARSEEIFKKANLKSSMKSDSDKTISLLNKSDKVQ